MKFTVDKVVAGGRLGTIIHTGINGPITLETPTCTLFTKGGSAPYLGIDMLSRVPNVPAIANVTLSSLAPHHENIGKFGKGIAEFVALKQTLILTSLHDASVAVPSGKNDKNGVAVWSKGGKYKLDPPLFIRVQEALQPDWFTALSDGDTDHTTSRKRLIKSVNNTLDFLDSTLELKAKSEVLRKSFLIGSVGGGFDVDERKRSAKETSARPVNGFLIEGFEKGNSGVDLFTIDGFSKALSATVTQLPTEKPRFIESVWSPLQVVKAFRLGVDFFSSAYPHTVTEKGRALVADYTLPSYESAESERCDNQDLQSGLLIDLNDSCFFEDFRPLLPGCPCYACENFSRSYIHHLLNTSELLAYVLLSIHNFYQYFEFFRCLRRAAQDERVEELEASLEGQCTAISAS